MLKRKESEGDKIVFLRHIFFRNSYFFLSKNDVENQQEFWIGLVMIDIFSQYATVIRVKSKQPPDVLAGFMEGLQKMGKHPKLLYSDEEGNLNSNDIMSYLEKENIEIHQPRGHPALVEQFIGSYKDMLFKRIEHDEKKGKGNIQWIDYNLIFY